MQVSQENKALATYLRSVLGGSPTVERYWDEGKQSSVDIMTVRDAPTPGVAVCATLGLSDHSTGLQVARIPLGVELLMAAGSHYACTPNIVDTCAFNMINSKMECRPGQVFPQVVEMYRPMHALTQAFQLIEGTCPTGF